MMIFDGAVKVNDVVETRRGRKLVSGDKVTVEQEISINGVTSFDVASFIDQRVFYVEAELVRVKASSRVSPNTIGIDSRSAAFVAYACMVL